MPIPKDIILDMGSIALSPLSQAVMLCGFNSNKLQNPPKIIKYLSCSTEIMLRALVDARKNYDINSPIRFSSSSLTFIDQHASFECLISEKECAAEWKQALLEWKRALSETGYVLSERGWAASELRLDWAASELDLAVSES
ncbi:uncharacterized protein ARMOST_10052 [Armillaria ostoyae]|uniref:Uncharacterized protein n=1 Tax=Armillaria ostoyae TaxID=47428 RepID=A0A284RDB4_ARMOS|nr:uncharacterized protein ARMOST_10052 [Armillaria ostoyae]